MRIVCGKDVLDISKVLGVSIETVTDRELSELEEEYHGYCPSPLDGFYERSYSRYSYAPSSNSKLGEKIEAALNKYWYEVSSALPQPKPAPQTRNTWEYARKKRSTFSVGLIDKYGDASVEWHFKSDHGTDPTGSHIFCKKENSLSLSDDIIPIFRSLSKTKLQRKTTARKAGEVLFYVLQATLDYDSLYNDERRDTPEEMPAELKALCKEYDDTYGKARKEKADNEARTKKREAFLKQYADKSILVIRSSAGIKKYLEGYCGFDIFPKKKEIEQKLMLYRENRRIQIRTIKASYITSITADFYEQNFLSSPSLSNSEKLNTYSSLRNFCCKYIPLLRERDFKIESIYETYPTYVSKEACATFKENWIRISRSCSALRRGMTGEKNVYEVLRLYDDRIRILRDYVWISEHDFIVISPYGISTIEVKNLRGNYVLTETGMLTCLSSNRVEPKNVVFQSKKHLETLRRNLKGCPAFSADIPLQEIICSAEPNFTIKNEYHYIPVCYSNTIDKYLLPESGKEVLSDSAMDEIQTYLLANQQDAHKFDVFRPYGEVDSRTEFIKNFAEVASGFLAAQDVERTC